MQRKLDIICHAFPAWKGNYTKSTVELMKELAVNNRVLYVDYAYTLKDIILKKGKSENMSVKQMFGFKNPCQEVFLKNGASLHVLTLPPIIPTNWINNQKIYHFLQSINGLLIKSRILKFKKRLGMKQPILINAFNPTLGNYLIKGLNQKANIYYCYDNISAANWASKHGESAEERFMKKAEAVVFSSEALYNSKIGFTNKAYVINNGVDLSVFENLESTKANELKFDEINIAYIGSIDDRIDYQLMVKTITHFKNWKFHFIGRIMTSDHETLNQFNNVIFYGALEAEKLPALLKKCHAGIIPFLKNEFTRNIYPMKANEYLAMGLPVIMTDFAEIKDLKSTVSVCDLKNFIPTLEKEVISDTPEKRLIRESVAQKNSWKNKAKEFEQILSFYA